MVKTNKKVVKLDVIQRLAELFPKMTMGELLEYIDYCQMIKQEMNLEVTGVTNRGDEVQ